MTKVLSMVHIFGGQSWVRLIIMLSFNTEAEIVKCHVNSQIAFGQSYYRSLVDILVVWQSLT